MRRDIGNVDLQNGPSLSFAIASAASKGINIDSASTKTPGPRYNLSDNPGLNQSRIEACTGWGAGALAAL
jgi:hypothetical protein